MRANRRLLSATAAAAVMTAVLGATHAVRADTAPPLTCFPGAGPCSQTAHFTDSTQVLSPLPAPSCPVWLSNDYALLVATGDGVEHMNVDKAQDSWFTSTFTGTGTITMYAPDQVDASDPNNPVLLPDATPDAAAPVYAAKVTDWFGSSDNVQSAVFHGTFEVRATAPDGSTVSAHAVFHQSYTPGSDPSGPGHTAFQHAHIGC